MKNTLLSTIFLLSGISILNKLTGFGREVALAYYFGTSRLMDDFLFADLAPNLIIYMMQGGLITAFIPIYNELVEKGLKKDSDILVDLLLSFLIISCLLCTAGISFLGRNLINIFSTGFTSEDISIILSISYYLLPVVFFNGVFNVLRAIQEARNCFLIPAISLTVANLTIVFTIVLLFDYYSIYSVPIGMLIASFLQVIIQIFACRKFYNKFSLCFAFKSEVFYKLVSATLPILIGNISTYVIMFNSRFLASYLDVGTISCLNYSTKLQLALYGFVVLPFITVSYPKLIKLNYTISNVDFNKLFNKYFTNGVLVLTPIVLFVVLHAEFIIKIIFERGAFSHETTVITAKMFSVMLLNLVFMYIFEFHGRYFYIQKAFRIPNIITAVGVLINVIFSYSFIDTMGVMSLVYGSLISVIFDALLIWILKMSKYDYWAVNVRNIIIFFAVNLGIFYIFYYLLNSIGECQKIGLYIFQVFGEGIIYFTVLFFLYDAFDISHIGREIVGKIKMFYK